MARFRLVKIRKRKVEVQKVKFKPNFWMLLLSFLCAFLVWLYVTGSHLASESEDTEKVPEGTQSSTVSVDEGGYGEI